MNTTTIRLQMINKTKFLLKYDGNASIALKKATKGAIYDIIGQFLLRGIQKFANSDTHNITYNIDDFMNMITIKDYNSFLEIQLNNNAVRMVGNKYMQGNMLGEGEIGDEQAANLQTNFFKGSMEYTLKQMNTNNKKILQANNAALIKI